MTSWQPSAQGYHALMERVRRYCVEGLSLDAAYEALHEIWLEHGFDTMVAEEGTLQDTLEAVMEKVWYGQLRCSPHRPLLPSAV